MIMMERWCSCAKFWPLASLMMLVMLSPSLSSNFSELLQPYWAPDHIFNNGGTLELTLDDKSGCGLGSRSKYLFGRVTAEIKLVGGDSAGVVTAFYMSSDGPNHDELDFEFLGNVSGEPYLVQTNVYANGTGNREMRHTLWFDPSSDFHSYSFLWNRDNILFLIDGIPIRAFANKEVSGVLAYPKKQAMGVYASIWNADDWATQGGSVKTNWSHAPFVSTVRTVTVDACVLAPVEDDPIAKCTGAAGQFWWDDPVLSRLSSHQRRQLKWVRRRHLAYDYCMDLPRFHQVPPECVCSC